jgi:formamidopyrimidine-DNA glycosylase
MLYQAVIAGIGNIHAGESLHRARTHPSRAAGGISRPEAVISAQASTGAPRRCFA